MPIIKKYGNGTVNTMVMSVLMRNVVDGNSVGSNKRYVVVIKSGQR